MTAPLSSIRRMFRLRRERRDAEPGPRSGPPALIEGETVRVHPDPQPAEPDEAAFAAQLLGQDGRKRGLRGGPPVLEQARSSYLEAEFSGPADRRLRTGRIANTAI